MHLCALGKKHSASGETKAFCGSEWVWDTQQVLPDGYRLWDCIPGVQQAMSRFEFASPWPLVELTKHEQSLSCVFPRSVPCRHHLSNCCWLFLS